MNNENNTTEPWRCHHCSDYILDRFVMRVNGETWHSNCVRCCECDVTLEEKCYSRDEKFYCKMDYFRCFGPVCHGCNGKLLAEHVVRRLRDMVFHESCFKCSSCSKKMDTGDRVYETRESRIICEEDHLKLNPADMGENDNDQVEIQNNKSEDSHSHQSAPKDNNNNDIFSINFTPTEEEVIVEKDTYTRNDVTGFLVENDSQGKNKMATEHETTTAIEADFYEQGGEADESTSVGAFEQGDDGSCRLDTDEIVNSHSTSGKKRGPRTTIKAKQLDMLKAAFIATPKPTRHIREQLAKDTGLSMRVIQVWFQNRRSKERRMKQVNIYSSRRHLYSRLPQRHLQSSFLLRQNECQTPNVNILDPGLGANNMYRYGDHAIPQSDSRFNSGTSYYEPSQHIDNESRPKSFELPTPVFNDSNNLCHNSNDAIMTSPYEEASSEYFAGSKSYLEQLSYYDEPQNLRENSHGRDYFNHQNNMQTSVIQSDIIYQ